MYIHGTESTRNSYKYKVGKNWKNRKAFCADLKSVYIAINREAAAYALERIEITWGANYKHVISWRNFL